MQTMTACYARQLQSNLLRSWDLVKGTFILVKVDFL